MSSLIDTGGPARNWLAGRQQALQQQAMQQREAEAAQQQQNQQRIFDLRRMEQEAEVAKMQLQQRAAAARSQILREDILSKLPQPQMTQGMGPVQNPATGGMAPMQDDWGQLREMVMNTDDPKALEDLNDIAGSRTELDALRKNWDELKRRAGTADPSQPIGRISLAIDAASKAGNAKRMQQLMDDMGKAEDEIEAQHQAKVKAEAKRETSVLGMMRAKKMGRQEAEDFYDLRAAGLVNQLQNTSGNYQSKEVAALAKSINAPVDGLALIPGTDRVDEVDGEEWVTVEKGGNRYEIKKAMWPIIQKFGSWEAAIQALRQANGMPGELAPSPPIGGHGFAQTTSTTPAPGAPTQASSGDPMAAARAALGDNATIEQIEQWMEAQGL
jgi:hypothetical protein